MNGVIDNIFDWFSGCWLQVYVGASFGLFVGLFAGEAYIDGYHTDAIEAIEIQLDGMQEELTEDDEGFILTEDFLDAIEYLRDEIEYIKRDYKRR